VLLCSRVPSPSLVVSAGQTGDASLVGCPAAEMYCCPIRSNLRPWPSIRSPAAFCARVSGAPRSPNPISSAPSFVSRLVARATRAFFRYSARDRLRHCRAALDGTAAARRHGHSCRRDYGAVAKTAHGFDGIVLFRRFYQKKALTFKYVYF
jgi:hypothetical protein